MTDKTITTEWKFKILIRDVVKILDEKIGEVVDE
jgi:hypothetical protein